VLDVTLDVVAAPGIAAEFPFCVFVGMRGFVAANGASDLVCRKVDARHWL